MHAGDKPYECDNYRLMPTLFQIRTVIPRARYRPEGFSPRTRYRPEGFNPRVDVGPGMITVLKWKKAYINLFITYFNFELNRTQLTSHTDTKLIWISDRYRLRDHNSPVMEKVIVLIYMQNWLYCL